VQISNLDGSPSEAATAETLPELRHDNSLSDLKVCSAFAGASTSLDGSSAAATTAE
jgi:hypothetical protein